MSGFRVALPNPDAVDSWMVKNRLYSVNIHVELNTNSPITSYHGKHLYISRYDDDVLCACRSKPAPGKTRATTAGGNNNSKSGQKNKKRARQPRFAFMTKSDVDHLEDGYRWRKYGQKAVKNSPFPRY